MEFIVETIGIGMKSGGVPVLTGRCKACQSSRFMVRANQRYVSVALAKTQRGVDMRPLVRLPAVCENGLMQSQPVSQQQGRPRLDPTTPRDGRRLLISAALLAAMTGT